MDGASTAASVRILRLPHYPAEWELPGYATPGSAGVDLRNAGPEFVLEPLERRAVPTGLAIAVPPGTEAQVRPRSGLALRRGLGVVNSPGTIDSDYRGEILVPLVNLGAEAQTVGHGERIAQMVLAPVVSIRWETVERLPESERGAGGFGSTGS